jgi:diacylglycerol O-acyltransferase
MAERLSAADASFFSVEGRTTPQHVGGLAIFEPAPGGFDYDRLVRLLEERISLVPRYRQKVRHVPAHLADPVWVDDPNFDITYHVRRSAMPRPGSDEQLMEFCARIQSRLLDRSRPLWEMYLVEGLALGRVAIITKTHHSMVDGLGAIDIAQVILDASPEPHRAAETLWMPEPEPTNRELVGDALAEALRRPAAAAEAVRAGLNDLRATAARFTSTVTDALTDTVGAVGAVVRPERPSPLTVAPGEQRRLAVARTSLEHYRQVRAVHGGTVNDVALATVAGALRGWLLFRGVAVRPSATVRALVPVSVADQAGGQVTALLVDLPVGESDPVLRLSRIAYAMSTHKAAGRSVSADVLMSLGGFAPATLHSLGARAANKLRRRMFSLVVTNVPGPQVPLYLAGARMREMFPILPLAHGQAVSIGLTSYDGGIYYGINGDRDSVEDIAVLASLVEESVAELVAVSPLVVTPDPTGRAARRRPAVRRESGRGPASTRSERP